MKVHKAMEHVSEIAKEIPNRKCLVRFETHGKGSGSGKQAGTVARGGRAKRDCAIWEDF